MSQQKKPKTASFQVFLRTGGPQPTTLDAEKINYFFKRNYAKVWAMTKGYIATFKSFEEGRIVFDLITDPRFTGNAWQLSSHIANEYRTKVNVLSEAKSYLANHFIANDIIGFRTASDDWLEKIELMNRTEKAYADLSEFPDKVHFGKID